MKMLGCAISCPATEARAGGFVYTGGNSLCQWRPVQGRPFSRRDPRQRRADVCEWTALHWSVGYQQGARTEFHFLCATPTPLNATPYTNALQHSVHAIDHGASAWNAVSILAMFVRKRVASRWSSAAQRVSVILSISSECVRMLRTAR